jgi:hypothetical protein
VKLCHSSWDSMVVLTCPPTVAVPAQRTTLSGAPVHTRMNFLDGGDVSGEMSAVAEFRRLSQSCQMRAPAWSSSGKFYPRLLQLERCRG